MKLTIGRLALEGGVGIPTIRYYQKRGLLSLPKRPSHGGFRVYTDADLKRLIQIREAQKLGFTLSEIATLLAHLDTRRCDAVKDLISKKHQQLTQQLAELRAAQQHLSDLNGACQGNCIGVCPLIQTFSRTLQPG